MRGKQTSTEKSPTELHIDTIISADVRVLDGSDNL